MKDLFTVGFENGTEITDYFLDEKDFNTWIKIAISQFGSVMYIKVGGII